MPSRGRSRSHASSSGSFSTSTNRCGRARMPNVSTRTLRGCERKRPTSERDREILSPEDLRASTLEQTGSFQGMGIAVRGVGSIWACIEQTSQEDANALRCLISPDKTLSMVFSSIHRDHLFTTQLLGRDAKSGLARQPLLLGSRWKV